MTKPVKSNSTVKKARTAKPDPTTVRKAITPKDTDAIRGNSKLATVIALLRRKEGATIDQMIKATGWQSHSVRGALSGALKKKRGLAITSAKNGDVRSYRIGA
jgi:hypothetical protein